MIKYEKIVKTFYDALEEGKILGRRCTKCGHVEFPPYLACNACGNLDTEWVEISGKGVVTQMIPCPPVFSDPGFIQRHGPRYCLGSVKPEDSDEMSTIIYGVGPDEIPQYQDKLPMEVKPVILQEDGYKMVFWQLADSETESVGCEKAAETAAPEEAADGASALTDIQKKVIECAAEAYRVDPSEITLDTNVREDLSSKSMMLVAFISVIEDALDAEISLRDAATMITIRDFADAVTALSK